MVRLLFFQKLHFPQVDLRILFFFSSFFLRMLSHLVPPGTGARVRYSLGTNVNTPFFQVPALEFGRGADVARPCTRALK